jgi:hypothetical protein
MKDALPKALEWLDSWPAGLKLNSDLSAWYVRVLGVCVAEGGPGGELYPFHRIPYRVSQFCGCCAAAARFTQHSMPYGIVLDATGRTH